MEKYAKFAFWLHKQSKNIKLIIWQQYDKKKHWSSPSFNLHVCIKYHSATGIKP